MPARHLSLVPLAAALAAGAVAPAAAAASPSSLAGLADRAASAPQQRPFDDPEVRAPAPGAVRARAVTGGGSWADAAGDNDTLAPDLLGMAAATTDDGAFGVGILLRSNALVDGDAVFTFVDTDGDPATGEPTFGGADIAVAVIGDSYDQPTIVGFRWDGVDLRPTAFATLAGRPDGTDTVLWTMSASEAGIAPGTSVGVRVGSIYSGVYSTYADFAPEPGQPSFRFTAGALAPPPPPPPPPAPAPAPAPAPPPAPAPTSTTSGLTPDTPPRQPLVFRALSTRSAGGAARVRISWTRGTGRVLAVIDLSTTVRGRRVARSAAIGAPSGTRTVTRTVRVPESWRGRRVRVRVTLVDDQRRLTRAQTFLLR